MRTLLPALLLLPLLAAPAAAQDPPALLAGCLHDDVVALAEDGTATPLRPQAYDPALSPDGTRLASTALVEKLPQLRVTDLRSGVTRDVGRASGYGSPAWSRDGGALAVVQQDGSGLAVVPVAPDGTPGEARAVPGTAGAGSPSWSPDGALLAHSDGQRVLSVRLDGGDREVLGLGVEPAWSPDGRELLVVRERSLERLRATTGERRTLLAAPARGSYRAPAWSPDGRTAYVQRLDDAGLRLVRVPVPAGPGPGTPDPAFRPPAGAGCPTAAGGPRPLDDGVPPSAPPLRLVPAPSRVEVQAGRPPEPDAAGVLVRWRLGPVAPLTPQDGEDAGRRLLGRAVLLRLPPSATVSVTAFPVDWSGRTGPGTSSTTVTPPEVATSLRVEPRELVRSLYGRDVVLGAVLRREDTGAPVPGARLQLSGNREGRPASRLAVLTTDADGRVSSRRVPGGTTRYTLTYAGDGPLVPAAGGALVQVQPGLRLRLSAPAVRRGAPASLRVEVLPRRAGLRVVVRSSPGYGRTGTRAGLTGRDGSVRLPLDTRADAPGRLFTVVEVSGDRDTVARTSGGPTLVLR